MAAEPAYTPLSSGSTDRATVCSPNRSPINSAVAGSLPGCQSNGRSGSAFMRSMVASSTKPVTDVADDGIPTTVALGSGCNSSPL